MTIVKNKLNPFKILVLLLYGKFEWMSWPDSLSVDLKLGPMSRYLRIPNSRLRSYLSWLEQHGYIKQLELSYGRAEAKITFPINLNREAIRMAVNSSEELDDQEEDGDES